MINRMFQRVTFECHFEYYDIHDEQNHGYHFKRTFRIIPWHRVFIDRWTGLPIATIPGFWSRDKRIEVNSNSSNYTIV